MKRVVIEFEPEFVIAAISFLFGAFVSALAVLVVT